MSSFSGFVLSAAQIGLSSVLIKPLRGIYSPTVYNGDVLPDIIAQAVLQEKHYDRIEITEHPVEQGAAIADHAFKLPARVILTLGWSNSPTDNSLLSSAIGAAAAVNQGASLVAGSLGVASAIQSFVSGAGLEQIKAAYYELLRLQETRALFELYTGKRYYSNMLCEVITTETDSTLENSLIVTMECQQVILVNTQIVLLPKANQKFPGQTSSIAEKGQKSLIPVS